MYSRAMADSSADSNVGKRDLICCQTGISGKIMAWIRGSTGVDGQLSNELFSLFLSVNLAL